MPRAPNAARGPTMRIVLDTNVTFSALLWRSTPYRLVETIRRQRQDHLFTSPALLEEPADILARPFAAKRLALLGRTGEDLLADYAGFALMVTPRAVPAVVIADPDDDQVIAAAVAAKADIIASGDRHLLSLGTYQGIQIIRPAEMLVAITGGAE